MYSYDENDYDKNWKFKNIISLNKHSKFINYD